MKLFKKNLKSEKTKIKTKTDKTTILALVIGVLLTFLSYLLSEDLIISVFVFCIMMYIVTGLKISEKSHDIDDALTFYHLYLSRLVFTSSYHEAFLEAVEKMEISALKDKLTDFIEAENSSELPLQITGSRSEYSLISFLYILYHNDEDYSSMTTAIYQAKLSEYENECKHKNPLDERTIPIIFVSLFVILVTLMINVNA